MYCTVCVCVCVSDMETQLERERERNRRIAHIFGSQRRIRCNVMGDINEQVLGP